MTDMPVHTPFPGEPDIAQPDYEPGGPDMPELDPGSSPVEMPDSQPFTDEGETA
jgi:hypothetical protein